MKKRDYFYKSSMGTRQFRLDLDALQLAILTGGDHTLLDKIEARHGRNCGRPLVKEVLDAKGVEWKHLLEDRP